MERALANHLGDGDANEIAACGGAAAPPDLYSREFSFTAASHVDRERNKNPAGRNLAAGNQHQLAAGDRAIGNEPRARARDRCARMPALNMRAGGDHRISRVGGAGGDAIARVREGINACTSERGRPN